MGRAMNPPPPSAAPVASLSPTLLARKGAARPAMRSQLAIALDPADGASDMEAALEDLGWNDMGEAAPRYVGRVVNFPRAAETARPARRPRGTALRNGRKAAFTLRLDAERHLRLRLACTLDACSAQALVIEALDRALAEIPEIEALAGQVADRGGKRRQS